MVYMSMILENLSIYREDLENTCDWFLSSVMTKSCWKRVTIIGYIVNYDSVSHCGDLFCKRTNALILCNIIIVFHKGAVYSNKEW